MTRLTVTLLFSKNKTKEPPGILQCYSSGEYFPFYFYDQKDVIHYIQWTNNYHENNNKINNKIKLFQKWSNKYDYDQILTDDLNEIRCEK